MKHFDRRDFLLKTGRFGLAAALLPKLAQAQSQTIDLGLPGGNSLHTLTKAGEFGEKSEGLILQRIRAPLLETPMSVFDDGVFTPNDKFYVRWHWADIPDSVDADTFRLTVRGQVAKPLSLSLAELMTLPKFEIAAVNQCSGNSRGFFQPRVPGGEWGNGAMGNARWTGVRLKDVLAKAGLKAGAQTVRFNGLDQPTSPDGPDFMKSLHIDHANDGEVMIAYAMNGKPLPLLNGFPLRLVVPGWYATYWVKMLNDIEVLDKADENFWMKTAYLVPDRPYATMMPGEKDVPLKPISRMLPRSFITNIPAQSKIATGAPVKARGIAFGGDCGLKSVEFSTDDGKSWQTAKLGKDEGTYGFRRWEADFALPAQGHHTLKVRCTNTKGEAQPDQPNWNGSGYMRNVVEATPVEVV